MFIQFTVYAYLNTELTIHCFRLSPTTYDLHVYKFEIIGKSKNKTKLAVVYWYNLSI